MTLDFTPPRLEEQKAYLEHLALCPQKASDYSFANIFGWAEEYGLEWTFAHGCVWIRQTRPSLLYWAPVGPWDDLDWDACALVQQGLSMTRVPERLVLQLQERLAGRVLVNPARGHWDYLYNVHELVELSGNKYHKKKNLLRQFQKHYNHVYKTMDADCIEATLQMQQEWCQWHECREAPALVAENQAIARVMQHWDRIEGLIGGSLHVDGVMVAYTVAERLDDESLVVHFEKGKLEYKGVYQAINQMFLASQNGSFRLVNREQDLDDPGLRKAKLSYHPEGFLKKYRVDFQAE